MTALRITLVCQRYGLDAEQAVMVAAFIVRLWS